MYNNVPRQNWLVTSEVGLTGDRIPAELSLSIHLAVVQPMVFSELHSFVENRRITGQNRIDYSNSVINLTARIGFNLSGAYRKAKLARRKDTYRIQPTDPASANPLSTSPTPKQPARGETLPPKTAGRFDRLPLNKPIKLPVNFDLEKADLLPDSFTDLDALAYWMQTKPTTVRLEGHTDLIGDAAENLELSRQRVVTVKEYLARRRVASYRTELA